MVPIAPSKTMTWCGSRSRAISGFSGNGGLRLGRSAGGGSAHRVVLRFGVMNDHGSCRLLGKQLEGLGEVHPQRLLGGKELEDGGVVVEIGTRAVSPRISLSAWDAELLLDAAMRPFGNSLRGFDGQTV